MAYQALARKHRSRTFDTVIGQEPIANTLKAAIKQNRVHHAYLFCGTRGVGKTSMARIFANELNNPDHDEALAEAIFRGGDVDVQEIDAASHTGVDSARELIANASYKPMRGHRRVYIIDEVHMLSPQAFNALLKTMEEPPEHVVFILCTTEPHKIIATIQSRCQRFDFRNIPLPSIADHLTALVKAEKFKADPDLIHALAKLGNGSMRDALSLLDRLMAAGEKSLTLALLEDLLGLPDRELCSNLLDALADGDPKPALESASALLDKGISMDLILEALLDRMRDLMVLCACGPDTPLVELTATERKAEIDRASRFDAAGLVHMIAVVESVQRALKSSPAPRALFDACMVRLAMTEKLADVTALLQGAAPRGRSPGKS